MSETISHNKEYMKKNNLSVELRIDLKKLPMALGVPFGVLFSNVTKEFLTER